MRTALLTCLLVFTACGGGSDTADPENCVVWYDGCGGNACEPQCVQAAQAVDCPEQCQSPEQPEGNCVFFAGECQFRDY